MAELEPINPYQNEQILLVDEIRQELAKLELKQAYLLELLEYYER